MPSEILHPTKNEATHIRATNLQGPKERIDGSIAIRPEELGSESFRQDYQVRYSYYTGAMYKAIASEELVIAMARAKLLSFYGTGGVSLEKIEKAIINIFSNVGENATFGMNLLHDPTSLFSEMKRIELFLKHKIKVIEAAAFITITPALVRFRLQGVKLVNDKLHVPNRIIAKVSRPEVAELFMKPAGNKLVANLLEKGLITNEEAALSQKFPLAQDVCVEADSGGHTDQGNPFVLVPAIRMLRDQINQECRYDNFFKVRVGTSGGIGTPESAGAAYMIGADFIGTGSINQCTVEAGISDPAKDILQSISFQDTEYAPAGDMFELGALVQVVKKGLFFPARAKKLHDLYSQHKSLEEIDTKILDQIEKKYFRMPISKVWEETKSYYLRIQPHVITEAEKNPKKKMALIFKWYFIHTTRLALSGDLSQKVDYQIHCGPALGAFNQWLKGTDMECWKNRHVDKIAELLLNQTASLLSQNITTLVRETIES